MRLRFTARATQDLSEIADYIRLRNPAAAQRVRTAILNSLENIVLFPRVGRRQDIAGVRKHVTPNYSYLVYYSLDEAADEIVTHNPAPRARTRIF